MITSIDHIHIHAADPWATIRFYESCLGAERLGSIPAGEGGENHGVLLGGQLLVVSEFPPGMMPAVSGVMPQVSSVMPGAPAVGIGPPTVGLPGAQFPPM